MSVTGKAALSLVALVLAGGAGLAAASPAGATTAACGTACMTWFNQDFGDGYVTAVAAVSRSPGRPSGCPPRPPRRPRTSRDG